MIAAPDLQYAAACWLVDTITRSTGTPRWVVSPGSRSTPLVLALHALGVPLHHVIDERAAAFFALGVARETGVPAPLLCTSGTALAHYLPAIIEASETRLPMLVVSADRPPELHGWGANQTIAQQGIFGAFVRAELDLGTPESLAQIETWGPRLAQFLAAGSGREAGPLHLNVPLRVPLEPSPAPDPDAREALATVRAWAARARGVSPVAAPALPAEGVDELREALLDCVARGGRALITVGPLDVQSDVPAALARFAAATGFPLLAEAASQCRFGEAPPGVTRVAGFDALLRSSAGRALLAPELVIQVGATPTSKSLELMAQAGQGRRFVLAPFGRPDPTRNAQRVLVGDVAAALDGLSAALPTDAQPATRPLTDYARTWRDLDARYRALAAVTLTEAAALSEGEVAVAVVDALGERDALLLGNSLAIRHVDAYATRVRPMGPVHSQRGASGIDGLMAGAAGAASTGRSVVALLGDVSFLHDLGGLGAHFPGSSVTVVVLQNGGGRIFELLPIAGHAGAPMNSFTTDHSADLAAAARVYGHTHVAVRTRAELSAALVQAVGQPGLRVIEAIVPPHDAGPRQRAIYAQVDAMLQGRQEATA